MMYMRKIKFNKKEFDKIREQFGGYLWTAVDTHRGVITAGDEYLSDLRDFLLVKRSKPEDILCAGVDLETGEVFFPPMINRHNPYVGKDGIPDYFRERVETLIRYFFEDVPAYQEERKLPRYSKKPTSLSFN